MCTPQEAVRRFVTSDGFTCFHLDGVWRDSIMARLVDTSWDGGDCGPIGDDGPLQGILDVVQPVLHVTWIDGPRQGQVANIPMIAVPRLVNIGDRWISGWRLVAGEAPSWVTEVLQYALNEGSALEGARFIADEIGDELDRGDDQPNLKFRIDYLPSRPPPKVLGKQAMQEALASEQDVLSTP
ncbi:hypothetical protein FHW79_005396 [Azospirillum sp. OGB3]|uniref:hypothetical protein n=1 Tax=Azospirillum sp. OGB3 TaxID=2587012 RepID=UPI001605B0CE|nr:hypothetical protein [Azospirillum sp. OGB3]MBB3267731.1 hypothetical protein [Azospirillum sp. OGB3]